MPRHSIFSATARDSLFSLPERNDELIRRYAFNETDLSAIRQRHGDPNRLGFAVQLVCCVIQATRCQWTD